jgi:Uri superfamily endonuclease
MDNLPIHPGTYALVLLISEAGYLVVGKLGRFEISPGIYVYLGSTHGPGGIRARLGRYLNGANRLHWHVDYLLRVSKILGYGFVLERRDKHGCVPKECDWSQSLASLEGTSIPIPKFGESDCNSGCPAHLIHFPIMGAGEFSLTILKHMNRVGDMNIRLV